MKQWPRLGRIEADGNRLRMVIDDPFLRDLLRNHAYESGIDIDTSFANEIVTLSWPSYVALLESLAGEEAVDEVVELFAADVRAALRRSAKRQAEFDEAMREPETDVEKLTRAAKFAVDYGDGRGEADACGEVRGRLRAAACAGRGPGPLTMAPPRRTQADPAPDLFA